MENILEVIDVCKSFFIEKNEVKVLQNVNCKMGRGEFVSIMGPSGSGKSTLLYLIGGLDKPTGGAINLGEKNWQKCLIKNRA